MHRTYLDDHLIQGEAVVYRGRPHPVMLARPAAVLAAAAAAFLLGLAYGAPPAVLAASGLAALAALPGWLRYRSMEYVVTNRRLCVKAGTFRVETIETVLNKVGTIGVYQTLPGRLLGYGTVVFKGIGGGVESLPAIAAPFTLRGKVHEALAAPSR